MATTPTILFVTTGLNAGGAEAMLTKLLQRLDRRVLRPIVVSLLDEGTHGSKLREANVEVRCLRIRGPLSALLGLLRIVRMIYKESPSITHGWMYHGNLFAAAAFVLAPGSRGALAWSIRHSLHDISRETRVTRVLIRLSALLSRWVNLCIYPSHRARQQHLQLGVQCRDNRVVPNGFDISRYAPASDAVRNAARKTFQVSSDEVLVVHLARFHPMKDHAGLLQAAAALCRKIPQVKFALAGTKVTMTNPDFRVSVEKAGVAERVIALGELPDVRQLLHAADIFCLPSAWGEAFPNALGEAMATGLPCVVTDVGECKEVLAGGGLVVSPSDPDSLASALEKLCMLNREERQRLGAEGRTRVLDNYQIERVVEEYRSVYTGLMPPQPANG